jgi:hypothetical protein
MSILSYIRGKYSKIQETFESFFIEISSGFKDGLAGKKADHWVNYLQKQRRERAKLLKNKDHNSTNSKE